MVDPQMAQEAPALPFADHQAGLLISTPEGHVTANSGWHTLTRRVLPPGTVDGWLAALHPDDRPTVVRALRTFDAGVQAACHVRLISGDGTIAATARLEIHRPLGWPPGTTVIAVTPAQMGGRSG